MITEETREQLLPSPDEAPLTWCPWCGEEYNLDYDELDTAGYVPLGCPEQGVYPPNCQDCHYWHEHDFCDLPVRHKCGGLIKFKSWAD